MIGLDLLAVIIARVACLCGAAGFLFAKWARAPRHYVTDYPFLMGMMMAALAVSKLFDIPLYDVVFSGNADDLYHWHPAMPLGIARWLFMLVVMTPLLYANLKVWVEKPRVRLAINGIYVGIFTPIICVATTFAQLNAILPWLLLPVAVLTVVTFLFAYAKRRLPEVHSLLVGLAWLGYLASTVFRPTMIAIGPQPGGYVVIVELVDMVLWGLIFLGFVIRPRYGKLQARPQAESPPASPQAGNDTIPDVQVPEIT